MTDYDQWSGSELKRVLDRTRSLNVSPNSPSLFYSGPSFKHGEQVRNRLRAERYAAREAATTLEMTDRGKTLEGMKDTVVAEASTMIRPSSARQYLGLEWKHTSGHYASHAYGDVKAFVAGARKEDVFRDRELPALIYNSRVQTINGVPRIALQEMTATRGIDYAYRAVALAHVRQEMQQALRTGDVQLIRDALEQKQLYQDQLRLDRGEKIDASPATVKQRQTELQRRTERLAAIRQVRIRAEALDEARKHVLGSGLSPEKRERLLLAAEQAMLRHQTAFRIKEIGKLRTVRSRVIEADEPDTRAINDYINKKQQYRSDLRAVRQANGQKFAVKSHSPRPTNRRLSHPRAHRGNVRLSPKPSLHNERVQL